MAKHSIHLTINGKSEKAEMASNVTLLNLLREQLSMTGTKNGCSAGECGACTVLLNGEPVNSCMVLAAECDGAEVLTVEGLAGESKLSALQDAFIEQNAVQCGFCTPGMLISAYALLKRNPKPEQQEIREAMVGNLCRCTGYERIVDAVLNASRKGEG